MKMEIVQVRNSKWKTSLLLLGAIAFVLFGLWMIRDPGSDFTEKAIGYLTILFFGSAIPIGIFKLTNNKAEIELTENGIVFQPETKNEIVIPWNGIKGFSEIRIKGFKYIGIQVDNPQTWIDQESNFTRRKLMEFNHNLVGTPFNINSASMNISRKRILNHLNNFHQKYRHTN